MHMSTRASRPAGALAIGLGLVGIGVAIPAAADAPSTPQGVIEAAPTGELVGTPRLLLIESRTAAGKVIEIGRADAQLTVPDDATPAAAASFTRASEPEAALAQALLAYPVLATEGAYVLTNQAGDVLARRDNADTHFRYLEVLDVDLDTAAANAYAQWTMTDPGDGWLAVENVQREPSGGLAALDMYDWKNEDGAQIQTYTTGGNTVQDWSAHGLDAEVAPVSGIVTDGVAPTLPTTVDARYEFGVTHAAEVVWDAPAATVWESDGVVDVAGTATGWFGEELDITATYAVGALGDALPATLTTHAGVLPEVLRALAPTSVERTVGTTDATVAADVTWDWDAVTTEALAQPGTLTVPATEGLGFAASLEVTLTEPESVNVLRSTAVRAWRMEGTSDLGGLTNGDLGPEAFGDWRAGGAANRIAENWVAYYFDAPRQLDAAAIYEPTGADNIGAVTFQYRTMQGGWVDVSTGRIENTGGRLALETDFEPVRATGFRAVIEHKSTASWMQLSELEAWGPRSGA